MNEALQNFHFLRPVWLLLLPVAAGCWWWLRRQGDPLRSWRLLIDPDLLPHLVHGNTPRANPFGFLLLTLWIALIVAVAGPTWRRAPSPFGENDRAVLVVLKASESMDVTDLPPSRLERARLEIADLAKDRPGLPLGLATYAGSAHLVLPPTRDTELVATMAANIETNVLPVPGDDLPAALNLAEKTLAKTPVGGSILLLADSIPPEQEAELANWRSNHQTPVMILPLVAPGSDDGSLRKAAKLLKAETVTLTADNSDTGEIIRWADRAPTRDADAETGTRWEEAGYWLTPLIALLILPGFRRVGRAAAGGTAPGTTAAITKPVVLLALGLLLPAPPARPSSERWGSWEIQWRQPQGAGRADRLGPPNLVSAAWARHSAGSVSKMYRRDAGAPWKASTPHEQTLFEPGQTLVGSTESPRRSWFFTPDQLGHRLFAKEDYRAAAATFVDAQWKGMAWFRAGEFERAEQAFARGSSPEAHFNRGDALVMLGKYSAAADQFAMALAARPGWREAEENKTLAELRAKMMEKKGGDMGDQKIGADEIVFEPGKKKKNSEGQDTEVTGGQALDDKAMQALWLRNVQTKPSDFLRAKFSYQHAMGSKTETKDAAPRKKNP